MAKITKENYRRTRNAVMSAIYDYVDAESANRRSAAKIVKSFERLRTLLDSLDMVLTIDEPNQKEVCYLSGAKFVRWERPGYKSTV